MLNEAMALDIGREALLTALIVAAPILITGIVVGLSISLFQTITQLQDQTFSIVPKIVMKKVRIIRKTFQTFSIP